MKESKEPPQMQGNMKCQKCGHVTPYIENQMMKMVMHHLSACHGRDVKELKRH